MGTASEANRHEGPFGGDGILVRVAKLYIYLKNCKFIKKHQSVCSQWVKLTAGIEIIPQRKQFFIFTLTIFYFIIDTWI